MSGRKFTAMRMQLIQADKRAFSTQDLRLILQADKKSENVRRI